MRTENAIIRSVTIGFEDHGMMTAWIHIHVEREGSNQGFGGYRLDRYDHDSKKSAPAVFMGLFVGRVLEVVGRNEWGKLVGAPCRVMVGDDDMLKAIGHFIEERWFCPEEEMRTIEERPRKGVA